MTDSILMNWLEAQWREAQDFAAASERLDLEPAGGSPPSAYLATFDCSGLIRDSRGDIRRHDSFHIWIQLGADHLRRVDPLRLAMCREPLWHPNALPTPFGSIICPGAARPGIGLLALLEQYYGVLTWQKVNRSDPLNPTAADWARSWDGKPIDDRPLRGRSLHLRLKPLAARKEES
jgi:hypothetical protein